MTGTFALPWWTLIAIVVLVALLGVLAGVRAGWLKAIGSVTQLVAVFGVLLLAWAVFDRLSVRDAAEQRRSFQTRLAELNGHLLAPASPLACLDALAGDALDEPCEKAIFANPESTAAAVSLMAGRMSLLREAVTHSADDAFYDQAIADLRRSLEPDRFGFVAQALATGEQCRADACEALSLLKDSRRVNANLGDRTFETYVGRYVAEWMTRQAAPAVASNPASKQAAAPTAAPATPAEQPKVAPVASSVNVDFPSAASIPPVSIMNNEPGVTGQGGTDKDPKAAAPARKPAAAPAPSPRAASRGAEAPAPTTAQ